MKRNSFTVSRIWILYFVIQSFFCADKLMAAQPEYVLKSAYIYNFLKYIKWQNENNITEWRVGIVGEDEALYNELKKVSQQKKIKNIKVNVSKVIDLSNIPKLHLVFIVSTSKDTLRNIASIARRTNTLIVTENHQLRTSFMVNMITNRSNTLSFEINKSNIIYEGLKMDKDILLLGGSELDVAQLLRGTEDAMLTLQSEVDLKEKQLKKVLSDLSNKEKKLKANKNQLEEQERRLENENKLLANMSSRVTQLQASLTKYSADLSEKEKKLRLNQLKLDQQSRVLEEKESDFNEIAQKIEHSRKNYELLRGNLGMLKRQLGNKQLELSILGETVSRQKLYLLWFTFAAVLFSVLLYVIWRLAVSWRKSSHDLAENITRLKHSQAQLEASKREAEKANNTKSEFISSMSHELRTPLNAIIGFSQLMKLAEMPFVDVERSADHIFRAGHHLLDLINDILSISLIESEKMILKFGPVNIKDIIKESIDLTKGAAKANNISVSVGDFEISNQIVFADKIRLKQVVLNLLSNALKYNKVGGSVNISFETQIPDRLTVKIADTGVGISKDRMQMIFHAFNRLGFENSNIQGTGIGLVITKKLIEKMNGSIDFDSVEGEGTVFWINIPLFDHSVVLDTPSDTRIIHNNLGSNK